MLDIILIILGVLCLITGLMGCILPFLPGPPVAYLGLVLLHFTDKVQYTTTQLIVWLLIVLVVQVLDYFTPMLGSKYSGGSRWGNWGCIIGTLIGVVVPAGITCLECLRDTFAYDPEACFGQAPKVNEFENLYTVTVPFTC